MSDDAVERCCDAFWSQTCEPGQEHDRARNALVSPMRAALAALKPGDKVGDGCVVVDKAMFIRAATWSKVDGFSSSAADCVQLSDEGAEALWNTMLAALDTGET